jgi:hypothetical protein
MSTRSRYRLRAWATASVAAFVAGIGLVGGTAAASEPGDGRHPGPHLSAAQRMLLRAATHRFVDVDEAVAAGYQPTHECTPGMGYHYANPTLAGDDAIDPTRPEILVYAPTRHGTPRLAALEYFRVDADQNLGTDDDRPNLFGHPFDGPMSGHPVPPGQPPMPIHYDLHVWLHMHNPAGELSPDNPTVHCPTG